MAQQGLPQGVPWPEGWPIPNYVNPPTRGTPALFLFTCAVTAVVVALRLYSRFYLTRSPGIDDIFLVAGFVSSTFSSGFVSDRVGVFVGSNIRDLQESYYMGVEQASLGCAFL